jgi:Tol biopolymer transport system component
MPGYWSKTMADLHESAKGVLRHGVIPETLRCSPDATRVAYFVQCGVSSYAVSRRPHPGIRYSLVLDEDLRSEEFEGVQHESLKFSLDSRRFAFVAVREQRAFAVVDGKMSRPYAAVGQDSPIFSPDSTRVAYAAGERPGTTYYVVDGRSGPLHTACSSFCFSPDSRRTAYIAAERPDHHVVVVDSEPSEPLTSICSPGVVFSPDSQRFAYAGEQQAGEYAVVADGAKGPTFESVMSPAFSPDSRQVIYPAKKGRKWRVCIDGEVGDPAFDSIGSRGLRFTPDSSRVTAAVSRKSFWRGERWFAPIGEEIVGSGYQGIGAGSPVSSPDSNRIGYAAQQGDHWCVVVDGVPGKESDGVTDPIFSPDSRHVAYRRERGGRRSAIADANEGRCFDGLGGTSFLFSPDSKHLVYDARRGDTAHIVIDDEILGEYGGFLSTGTFVFDNATTMRVLALRGYEVFAITCTI